MIVRTIIAVCLCLAFVAPSVQADNMNERTLYDQISKQCGLDPFKTTFADVAYVEALADAAKAMKAANKAGDKDQRNAIAKIVEKLKECRAEEERKFEIDPINNCDDLIREYRQFAARSTLLIEKGKITFDYRNQVQFLFREPAKNCIREIALGCVKPNDLKEIQRLIDAAFIAGQFEILQNETSGILGRLDPFKIRFKFCTDTDYGCNGDKTICNNRITTIKGIMNTYFKD